MADKFKGQPLTEYERHLHRLFDALVQRTDDILVRLDRLERVETKRQQDDQRRARHRHTDGKGGESGPSQ